MTAIQVIDSARLDAMAESVVEDNTCYRIQAGSSCAGSDVAAYALEVCAYRAELLVAMVVEDIEARHRTRDMLVARDPRWRAASFEVEEVRQ